MFEDAALDKAGTENMAQLTLYASPQKERTHESRHYSAARIEI